MECVAQGGGDVVDAQGANAAVCVQLCEAFSEVLLSQQQQPGSKKKENSFVLIKLSHRLPFN